MLAVTGLTVLALFVASPCSTRKITVKNSCSATIYPAYVGEGGAVAISGGASAPAAGWELAKGGTTDLDVPEGWNNARIWARTGGCNGNVANCKIGSCAGNKLDCPGDDGKYSASGATLAEFTFTGTESYDGFSVPISIIPSDSSCTTGSCGTETDILTICDPSLVYPFGQDEVYSCASACLAGVEFKSLSSGQFDPSNSPTCCTGKWLPHGACPKSNIPFYNVYKDVCKTGYVYADDDNDKDAVLSCASKPSYTVEFCPGGKGSGLDDPLKKGVTQNAGGDILSSGGKVPTAQGQTVPMSPPSGGDAPAASPASPAPAQNSPAPAQNSPAPAQNPPAPAQNPPAAAPKPPTPVEAEAVVPSKPADPASTVTETVDGKVQVDTYVTETLVVPGQVRRSRRRGWVASGSG